MPCVVPAGSKFQTATDERVIAMKNTRRFNSLAAVGAVALLGATAPALVAAQSGTPPQAGGGWGYGMGPCMTGDFGPGPGMMWDFGRGPGMVGGPGMGPGMMRGSGMMGPYWGSGLDLTDEQQAKVNTIQDETRKAHWSLMGAMMDQQARLRDLYSAPKRDAAAIDEAYKTLGKLQQQMYDSAQDARKRMEAVLTPEQHEKLRNAWRRGGWGPNR